MTPTFSAFGSTVSVQLPGSFSPLTTFDNTLRTDYCVNDYSPQFASGTATIVVDKGTLYVERLMLLGVDVLKRFGAPGRLALRSGMRRDEFR